MFLEPRTEGDRMSTYIGPGKRSLCLNVLQRDLDRVTAERDALRAEIERLRHAVELGAKQKLPEEATDDEREDADYEHGYKALVKLCRAATEQPKP
jgi:hypothetical protein